VTQIKLSITNALNQSGHRKADLIYGETIHDTCSIDADRPNQAVGVDGDCFVVTEDSVGSQSARDCGIVCKLWVLSSSNYRRPRQAEGLLSSV